ncbi:MAG: SHOCT domain-containing protein [Dehalococcoidia bacterium]|nr:MAG: SHOCT domain-containing protein [Dehalococcoidia bacterium]
MMWHSYGWDNGDWFGMTLMMAFMWVPILVLVVVLVRSLSAGGGGSSPQVHDSAEDEARRAYARGDLDRERFLQITSDLREGRPGGPK